jgi:hypothetical protein
MGHRLLAVLGIMFLTTPVVAQCYNINGREDNAWTVYINVPAFQFTGWHDSGGTKTARIMVWCNATHVTMQQSYASDGNNCRYELNRYFDMWGIGRVSGGYTCTRVPGVHPFEGTIQ